MEKIQFIQVDPEQFRESILKPIKVQLADLIKCLQTQLFKEEYLSREEVSNMLKVDLSTIHNWSKKGKLTKHCIGNRVYYKRSEIENQIIQINYSN